MYIPRHTAVWCVHNNNVRRELCCSVLSSVRIRLPASFALRGGIINPFLD